ncbi:class I SAM-dependent methyltransferase [Nocardia sp. NPDC046473]|uniref:O-methyltransferase n=1 Tax=Nocardia sp. NPDC046473 TaxID=3155733 RepID=UPI003403762B
MAGQTDISPGLVQYLRDVSLREDSVLRDLREETEKYPMGHAMQIMPEEGQFLSLLVRLIGARSILEVGTFTGYSSLCMARSLPADGRLVTCDISEKWPQIATPYWSRAGVADRIELLIGDARSTLAALLEIKGPGCFDLAFIDADKAGYPDYYEKSLTLVRHGGLILLDNTLFFGRVIDPDCADADTEAIRALNSFLLKDDRIELSLLPFSDGITMALKK